MADIKGSSLATGLQAYWDFQETSAGTGSVTRQDLTGNGNHLLDAGTTPSSTSGKLGTCIFPNDANNEYLYIADNAYVSIVDGWSVSMWIKFDSTYMDGGAGSYHYFLSKRSGENGIQHWLQNDSGTWYLYIGTGSGSFSGTKLSSPSISLDTWYHIVIYHNGASSYIYLNGTQYSISLNAITDPAANLEIGANNINHTTGGYVDEVGIWNRELTQTDVTTLYNSGTPLPYWSASTVSGDSTLPTSMVSYWTMDETSSTRADSVGSNSLTDSGSTSYATGKQSNAADFESSSSQKLSKSSAAGLGTIAGTGDFTLAAWFNPESAGTETAGLRGYTIAGGTDRIVMDVDVTNIFCQMYDGTNGAYITGPSVSASTWYHFVLSRSGGTLSLYVNGGLFGTNTGTYGTSSSTNLNSISTIELGGESAISTAEYYDGLIDEAVLWNKAITPGEVRALYGYGTPPPYTAAAAATTSSATKHTLGLLGVG